MPPRYAILLFPSSLLAGLPAAAADPQPTAAFRAADRGAPTLFLEDGLRVFTNYAGDFPAGQVRPLALASADFDEDGMPDLAAGYAAPAGGFVVIHRGNVDALWPEGKTFRNGAPPAFLPDVRSFALPEAPDLLGAGDFDADGHFDLVAAHLGTVGVPNSGPGVWIAQDGENFVIGGTDTPAGNIIAFNTSDGVRIDPAFFSTAGVTNTGPNTVVGNTIFSNGGAGVRIPSGTANQVTQNSIYGNTGLGIDIDAQGHQANINCQTNQNGGNGLQNAPVLAPAAGGALLESATATDPNGNTSEFSNCGAPWAIPSI